MYGEYYNNNNNDFLYGAIPYVVQAQRALQYTVKDSVILTNHNATWICDCLLDWQPFF